jgi:hypothetical protein
MYSLLAAFIGDIEEGLGREWVGGLAVESEKFWPLVYVSKWTNCK